MEKYIMIINPIYLTVKRYKSQIQTRAWTDQGTPCLVKPNRRCLAVFTLEMTDLISNGVILF